MASAAIAGSSSQLASLIASIVDFLVLPPLAPPPELDCFLLLLPPPLLLCPWAPLSCLWRSLLSPGSLACHDCRRCLPPSLVLLPSKEDLGLGGFLWLLSSASEPLVWRLASPAADCMCCKRDAGIQGAGLGSGELNTPSEDAAPPPLPKPAAEPDSGVTGADALIPEDEPRQSPLDEARGLPVSAAAAAAAAAAAVAAATPTA